MTALMRPERNDALGIHVVNGPMSPDKPCVWATRECIRSCYVRGYIRRWRNAPSGAALLRIMAQESAQWLLYTPDCFKGIKLVRLCSRGEGLSDRWDVEHVRWLATTTPGTKFLLPTRCHTDPEMRSLVESRLFGISNLHILASVDAGTTQEHFDSLVASGWSTMGFFSVQDKPHPLAGDDVERCPKTWGGAHGATACKRCGERGTGCFRRGQKNIYLRQHS